MNGQILRGERPGVGFGPEAWRAGWIEGASRQLRVRKALRGFVLLVLSGEFSMSVTSPCKDVVYLRLGFGWRIDVTRILNIDFSTSMLGFAIRKVNFGIKTIAERDCSIDIA